MMNNLAGIISIGRSAVKTLGLEFKLDNKTLIVYTEVLARLPMALNTARWYAYMIQHIVPLLYHFSVENDASVQSQMFYWQSPDMFADEERQALEAIRCLLDASLPTAVRLRQCVDHLLIICRAKNIDVREMMSEYTLP